jgi:hypothetical protein
VVLLSSIPEEPTSLGPAVPGICPGSDAGVVTPFYRRDPPTRAVNAKRPVEQVVVVPCPKSCAVNVACAVPLTVRPLRENLPRKIVVMVDDPVTCPGEASSVVVTEKPPLRLIRASSTAAVLPMLPVTQGVGVRAALTTTFVKAVPLRDTTKKASSPCDVLPV